LWLVAEVEEVEVVAVLLPLQLDLKVVFLLYLDDERF